MSAVVPTATAAAVSLACFVGVGCQSGGFALYSAIRPRNSLPQAIARWSSCPWSAERQRNRRKTEPEVTLPRTTAVDAWHTVHALQVGRTPGISCEAPIRCTGFVCFIPLLDRPMIPRERRGRRWSRPH